MSNLGLTLLVLSLILIIGGVPAVLARLTGNDDGHG